MDVVTVPTATVIGAGLAGCEAAYQLAKRGVDVELVEMKPVRRTPAHHMDTLAELVCSNSLKADRVTSASGLLKAEMRLMDSLIIRCADAARVPAGGALAVDRDAFSQTVTRNITSCKRVTLITREARDVPDGPCVVATGPLTDGPLLDALGALLGQPLFFFDAAAPIVEAASLDMDIVFRAARYAQSGDYLNCPMNREEYDAFVEALLGAETVPMHAFESGRLFEGCMPIEEMARRGPRTLAFGPLKPVGLNDPRTGRRPHAVVQLRQDNAAATLYGLVGFQTRLNFPEQKRVFSMIPGLERASFARYGVMHRNSYINAPDVLTAHYRVQTRERLYIAGQLSGVEGYVESAASGLVAGVALANALNGLEPPELPAYTMTGALGRYISAPNKHFAPMNANFGILEYDTRGKKQDRYAQAAEKSLEFFVHGDWGSDSEE